MPIASLPEFEANILKNMWVSCSNRTAKALSEMINRKVDVTSTLKILLINDVPKLLNPKSITTTVIFTKLIGAIKGVIVLSSSLKDILKMADIFLRRKIGYFSGLSDENVPVIKELANILAGYYITTLNELFETKYSWTSPSLSVNPFRAIEEFSFGEVYKEKIYVLTFKARFLVKEEKIKEDVLLLFRKESIEKILELVSKKVKLAV